MAPADSLTARFIESILPASGALAGVLIGYALFEITEWRKRLLQRKAIRSALRSELQAAELILNSLVTRFAVGSNDRGTVVKEVRWLLEHGKSLGRLGDMPDDLLEKLKGAKDDDIFNLLKLSGYGIRNVELAIPLTIVDAALSSPVAGLSPETLRQLSMLKWQGHLLAYQARWMEEFLRLSLTVTDLKQHQTVIENHEDSKRWYARRASFMLSVLRQAATSL